MRNIKWLSGVFMMALALSFFSACSEDDNNVKPSFPEKQAVDCSIGEEKTITFKAEQAWTLASSRLWCKFKDGDDIVPSLSGEAGEHTITFTVTEDVWGFEDAMADILMGMENEVQVVAVVNRAAKGYKIEAYIQDGDHKVIYDTENPVVLPYLSYKNAEVNVAANFDWKVVNCPEWIMIDEKDLLGEAGKTMTWELKFQATDNISKVNEQSVILDFVDANGTSRLKVPVKYDGMPEDEIDFIRPQKNYWDWYFSADATKYWQSSGMAPEADITQYDAPLTFKVLTRGEFEIVRIVIDENGYTVQEFYYPPMHWFNALPEGEDGVTIEVAPNDGTERKGCVMVVPNKVLEGITDGIFGLVDDFGIKYEYDKYIAFEFTQEGEQASNRGFAVEDPDGNSMASSLMDMSIQQSSEELIAKFGTDNVYMLNLNGGTAYDVITITPNGYPNMSCTYELENQWSGVTLEPNWQNGIYLNIPAGEKDTEMRIKFTVEGQVYAVLLLSQYY